MASRTQAEPSGRPTNPRTDPPPAWTPTGVWQVASSTRTAARSASRAACAAGSSSAAARSSPARPWIARHPCPGAGTNSSWSSRRWPSSRPSRRSPAAASTSASTSPAASLRRRVSTLPRSSTTSRPGSWASSWARRRSDDVPTRRPSPTITSAASSRGGTATIAVPPASSPGTSLAECTARSMSPRTSASSIASTQRDLSPAARPASPDVRRTTTSAPSSRSATQFACASASALPRVPMRISAGAARGLPRPRPRRPGPRPRARTARAAGASARGAPRPPA